MSDDFDFDWADATTVDADLETPIINAQFDTSIQQTQNDTADNVEVPEFDNTEITDLMDDRRKLNHRLQTDPEFDKSYKEAEKQYFNEVNGISQDEPNGSVDNKLLQEAKRIVNRMHKKTQKEETQNDQTQKQQTQEDEETADCNLTKFGVVTEKVPDDPVPVATKPKSEPNSNIVIKHVDNLVINFNFYNQ